MNCVCVFLNQDSISYQPGWYWGIDGDVAML